MRCRFVLGLLGLCGMLWAACQDAGAPARPDFDLSSAAVGPHAAFSHSCTQLTCQFTDQSVDSTAPIVAWHWLFGDGQDTTLQHPVHSYAGPGTYNVILFVTDSLGASDSVAHSVTVTGDSGGGNPPPQAFFDFNCSALTCQFTDRSVDSGGAVVQWAWLFGDAGTDTTQNPTHTYAAAGSYIVTLFVRDNQGASDSTSRVISVSDTSGGAVLTLMAEGFRAKGRHFARLLWTGATVDSFAVFRDSVQITAVSGDTTYVDNIGKKANPTYVYQVCQVGGGNRCSNTATVRFSR
jgi:PKD repeat protein